MTNNIILAAKTIWLVFKNFKYIVLSSILTIVIGLIVFSVSTLILRYELLVYIFTSDIFTFNVKMQILLDLLMAIRFIFPLSSVVVMVVVSVLLAIDISLLVFYLRRQMRIRAEEGVRFFGLMLSIIGIGCSTCGTIILSSIFGFTAATVLISFLPLAGLEFGIAGIFVLLFSIYLISIKIQTFNNCKIS